MTAHRESTSRRDFLVVSGTAFAAVGAAHALWPFAAQMSPDASTLATANLEVDVGSIGEGQGITVIWRGKPVFIRHRSAAEIEKARAAEKGGLLDLRARNAMLVETAAADDTNRVRRDHPEWLVVVGSCTHLGCVPQGQKLEPGGAFGGWTCACHGSMYDVSGRVTRGPAPRNLDVPPYYFISDRKILIGLSEPPKGAQTA